MKIRRKIYAVLLTAAMILTLLPAMAFAEWEEGLEPIDAAFPGSLSGEIGDTTLTGLYYTDGSSYVDVWYANDENPVGYTYTEYEYKDKDGDKVIRSGFLRDGADPEKDESYAFAYVDDSRVEPIKPGENEIPVIITVPYTDSETGELEYKTFDTTYYYWATVEKPISIEFIPAPGFNLTGVVGYNFLNEEDFYGEGNMFRVSYEELIPRPDETDPMGYTADYTYVKTENGVEGFFDNANPEYERFELTDGVDCYLEKGINKAVELTYYDYAFNADGEEELIELPFTVDIDADKYSIWADDEYISTYTGSAIKRSNLKFNIYNTDDEIIPSKEYTFKTPTYKSMGWHNLTVTIKDEYKSKYDRSSIKVRYGIGPKNPVLSKIVAGNKSLTVKWNKMSASHLKKIDGFYIVLSTDKYFLNNNKKVFVSKKAFKSGKKVIKKLSKGKKYYVKMYAYKTIKQNGRKFKMPSADSKVLYKKTK